MSRSGSASVSSADSGPVAAISHGNSPRGAGLHRSSRANATRRARTTAMEPHYHSALPSAPDRAGPGPTSHAQESRLIDRAASPTKSTTDPKNPCARPLPERRLWIPPNSKGVSMFHIPAALVALTITASTSTAVAIDCLSYLAADSALEKAKNEAHAAYRNTVQAAEAAWYEALQHREAAWQAAGKAAAAALAAAEESAGRDLHKAKMDADAIRKEAIANARARAANTVDKARAEIIGPDQTAAYRKVQNAHQQVTDTVYRTLTEVSEYLAIFKEFLEARVALENALANVPAEAKAQYDEIRIAAEVDLAGILISIVQAQREAYAAATAKHEEFLTSVRDASNDNAVHLKAGQDAYTAYWQTIHNAYFTYRKCCEPCRNRAFVC